MINNSFMSPSALELVWVVSLCTNNPSSAMYLSLACGMIFNECSCSRKILRISEDRVISYLDVLVVIQ